jgi:hypothetical protein
MLYYKKITLVQILNPLDERVEIVLKRAGLTIGQKTSFSVSKKFDDVEVIGVSSCGRLVIKDENDCYIEYEV